MSDAARRSRRVSFFHRGRRGIVERKATRKSTARKIAGRLSYGLRVLPSLARQRLTRGPAPARTHLIIALADHFEPAIVPHDGRARAPYHEQERRLEVWCREYPRVFDAWRDAEGRPFVHTYFYPAEQYDKGLVGRLAEHCHAGWGEIEVHLHHGADQPDTAENTRRLLIDFRDKLAIEHGALCYAEKSATPKYAFVHGNFALANSAGGRACGVDAEMQVLAETGCYADLTLPTGTFHAAQTAKINSLYECGLPLDQRVPHRAGRDLRVGEAPSVFPLMIQGPLMMNFAPEAGTRRLSIENGALTGPNPATLRRLQLWKRAGITVQGRPDCLFIKLHCHGMDPTQEDAMVGASMKKFMTELVEGAAGRGEQLHFVTAREMTNIILALCDAREGSPGEFRDYRFQRTAATQKANASPSSQVGVRG